MKRNRVLIIGDTHAPAMHRDYIPFLKSIQKKYNCNKVVHIGDLVDWASISYHPKAPSLMDSEKEFRKAQKQVQRLHRAFPRATWCIGNHDSLTERKAADLGLPLSVLKGYKDLWGLDGWEVVPRYESVTIDGVIYQHGDRGKGGQICAAYLNAQEEHASVVQGHLHAQFGVLYHANKANRVFGMQVGCGVDYKLEAMAYGKKYNRKPILGCGVVLNGVTAICEPMKIGTVSRSK